MREGDLTSGPNAYPKTKKLVPSVATSAATPNSCATGRVALLKILLPIVALIASKARIAPMPNFFFIGQFCACRGSSALSYSTTYSSRSGRSGGYGFPAPIGGSGLCVLRRLRVWVKRDWMALSPTVCACWERCVSMRLMASGLRSVGCRYRDPVVEAVRPLFVRGAVVCVRISCSCGECGRKSVDVEEPDDEDELVCRESGASASLRCDVVSSSTCGLDWVRIRSS